MVKTVIFCICLMSACLSNNNTVNSEDKDESSSAAKNDTNEINKVNSNPDRNNTSANSSDKSVSSTTARQSTSDERTKIGVLVSANFGDVRNVDERLNAYKKLNVKYVRHYIAMDSWNGSNQFYNKLQNEGYKIILNVNYFPVQEGNPKPFPTNLEEYKRKLNDILSTYKPELVSIENEEYNNTYHSGSMQDYLNELKVAVEVAHSHNLKVTNGGLTAGILLLLVWKDYKDRGLDAEANDFAKRTLTPDLVADLPALTKHKALARGVRAFDSLITGYKNLNLDYVNFHWYEPVGQRKSEEGRNRQQIDTKALGEAVAYLERRTGKRAITNEIGQFNQSPHIVKDVLAKCVELKLPYVIWYSGDGGGAVALTDSHGILRENGKAFAEAVKSYDN